MATDRDLGDFWCIWLEGAEWPSWYGSEELARLRAKDLARRHPGRSVYVSGLLPRARIIMPDALDVLEMH